MAPVNDNHQRLPLQALSAAAQSVKQGKIKEIALLFS